MERKNLDDERGAKIAPPQISTIPEEQPEEAVLVARRVPVVGLPYMSDDDDNDEDIPVQEIELSDEQQAVLDRVKAGHSIFFTGSAGTGKSVLLREIIRWCRHVAKKKTAVTASTGIAGYHIGGSTLHSWAGIRLGIGTAAKLADTIHRRATQENEKAQKMLGDKFDKNAEYYKPLRNWLTVEVLIIDEISMISGPLFGKLEKLARILRENDLPFGGIQLVLAGDFYQLPPVHKAGRERPKLAFEAYRWDVCVGKPIVLTKVFRQKETEFIDMLNSVRVARVDNEVIDLLRRLSRKLKYDNVEPIDLYPLRSEAEAENLRRLAQLASSGREYEADDSGGTDEIGMPYPEPMVQKHLDQLPAPKLLKLKHGARVMLVMNLVQGRFVNGSIGEVVGFMTVSEAQAKQIAIGTPSISRSDVRAGRARQADHHLTLLLEDKKLWPLVNFQGYEVLCVPRQFTALDEDDDRLIAKRIQVPLILAWALTIHKSQGQTLSLLRVHARNAFDYGQVYVALSRATSLEALEIVDFDPSRIKVHPIVLRWMNTSAAIRAAALVPPKVMPAAAPAAHGHAQVLLPAAAQAAPPPDVAPAVKPEPEDPVLPVKPEPEGPVLPVKAEPGDHPLGVKAEDEEPAKRIKSEPPDSDADDGSDILSQYEVIKLDEDYVTEDELWAQSQPLHPTPEDDMPRARKRKAPPDSDTDEEFYWTNSQDVSGYLDQVN